MTNKEIITSYEDLIDLRKSSTTRFPARVSFAIARNIRALKPIYEDIINIRMETLKEHGEPVAGEVGYFSPKLGHEEIMKKELEAIDNTEAAVCALQRFSFKDIENLDLSISDMDALYFMLDEN